MNPQRYLIPAVLDALTQGGPLPGGALVTEFQPGGASAYVLVTQPTVADLPGTAACRMWSATLLLDCVTLSEPESISAVLCDELADAVLGRLQGAALPMGGGLQLSGRATLELLTSGADFDTEQIDIHRYLRMRFTIYTS
ncbi:hypothetical protein [Hymenobacter psychrophilus]|uniref:DUF3168 domain-containing protein n=1 Tax=Hymenobacter psychrophilus TaxID=651662 RepID=A0A1H3P931_9BACT|nr:hypothetical protein [Hymenobacter psychrophilus]SDY97571.1 hypothetical protein SAMN04488069_1257 [Hymenobacter psychrophilus]